jgi:hypothetical protein
MDCQLRGQVRCNLQVSKRTPDDPVPEHTLPDTVVRSLQSQSGERYRSSWEPCAAKVARTDLRGETC